MKKTFLTLTAFLLTKSLDKEGFDKLEAEKQSELYNELTENNAEALKEMTENNVSKEDLQKAIAEMNANSVEHNKVLTKHLVDLGLEMKSYREKGQDTSKHESEIIKFIEKRASITDHSKRTTEGIEVKAAALMTTANIVPNVTNGFNQLEGNFIDPNIHSAPKQDPFIMSLVDTTTQEGTESVWYVQRINEEGDAAFIAEGALKPLADGEWKEFKADVKEVAVRWKVSKRMLNNAPLAISNFRTHVNELIELKMDSGVLSGDGTGDNLAGVAELASPFVVPAQLANFYTEANIFDAIIAVATYVRLNNFKGALVCILNPVWEAKMKGYKDANNNYIIPPFVTPDGKRVGSITIQFENGMAEADILLGDLKQFKCVISSGIKYFEGFENDDFSKNLESRKLEAFVATYLPSTKAGAIIYDDIDTILEAIEFVPA